MVNMPENQTKPNQNLVLWITFPTQLLLLL